MICKRCGTKFLDGMFCPECGTRIAETSDVGGENLFNKWETAFEYSDEEEYNTNMYGPQGKLEEEWITETIEISDGEKSVFENKKLIFEVSYEYIEANDNSKLEFRNCMFILSDESTAINTQKNVSIIFENCLIKGNGMLIYENYCSDDDDGTKLEFLNCAFINDISKVEAGSYYYFGTNYYPIETYGSAYFENCFFSVTFLGIFNGKYSDCGVEQNVRFKNCVIIGKTASIGETEIIGSTTIIRVSGDEIAIGFDSCYIRSLGRLVGRGELGGRLSICNAGKISFKNSYLNDYSYINCDELF